MCRSSRSAPITRKLAGFKGSSLQRFAPARWIVLYIEGPANSSAAKERTAGMNLTKPANIQVKTMRANWTEESAYRAVSSWLRLRTSQETSHRSRRRTRRQHGGRGTESVLGNRRKRPRAMAQDSLHRLRRLAQNRARLGFAAACLRQQFTFRPIPTWRWKC